MKSIRKLLPALISLIIAEEPAGDRLPLIPEVLAEELPFYSQQRWGLRRIDTGVWYSPVDLHRKRLYPMAFGCRAEAMAKLNGMGRHAVEIWEPKPFSDNEYQSAISAVEASR